MARQYNRFVRRSLMLEPGKTEGALMAACSTISGLLTTWEWFVSQLFSHEFPGKTLKMVENAVLLQVQLFSNSSFCYFVVEQPASVVRKRVVDPLVLFIDVDVQKSY